MKLAVEGVAVVTGGGAGLGRAMALELAGAGAAVAVVDRDRAAADATAAAVRDAGGRAEAFVSDVTDRAAAEASAEAIRTTMGPVRSLVCNAGVVTPPGQPFTLTTEDDWDRAFAVNVKGAAFWAGAVVGEMEAAGEGAIVVISSIVGVIAAPFLPAYSVSKTAALGLTRVLARQLAPKGVTVNAVCPGYVWTPLWEDLGRDVAEATGENKTAREVFDDRVRSMIPMGRAQSAEDVAAAVVFLCSDRARNVTGQVLGVDGGITI